MKERMIVCTTKNWISCILIIALLLNCISAAAQPANGGGTSPNLVVPILLEKEKRLAGNPLATYGAMLALENSYRQHKIFSNFYDEIRFNFEQFLGFPDAGIKAMHLLPDLKRKYSDESATISANFYPQKALDVIVAEAKKTRVVIWGEEHHLPQTRSLFEDMVRALWKQGYRYLAAETFGQGLRDSAITFTDYETGYYTQDPVFASAVNLALELGYKLVDYDSKEQSATEPSLRDIRQAENIRDFILSKDSSAKVLVIAGRGHASEARASDGWQPMAYVLKKITGIDPFTLYTPTMTERMASENEHPLYRDATKRNLVNDVTIFKDRTTNGFLNTGAYDADVFFPRTKLVNGRPEWLFSQLRRKAVKIPDQIRKGSGLRLVQAFEKDHPASAIPVDQLMIRDNNNLPYLALPPGDYWIRTIDEQGQVHAIEKIQVK